jgi:hypothetical protein
LLSLSLPCFSLLSQLEIPFISLNSFGVCNLDKAEGIVSNESGQAGADASRVRVNGRGRFMIPDEMISAGVFALRLKCPFDVAFPAGGEDEAVEAVLRAALEVLRLEDFGSIGQS